MWQRTATVRHPTSSFECLTSQRENQGFLNMGLRSGTGTLAEDEEIYCDINDLTQPVISNYRCRHRERRRGRSRSSTRSRSSRKNCCKLNREGILLATSFMFTLLGIIITSSYILDKESQQEPRILYSGISITSLGILLIVISLLPRLVKNLRKKAAFYSMTRETDSPIFFIGCDRENAVAYQPILPPSYYEALETTISSYEARRSVTDFRGSHRQEHRDTVSDLPSRPPSYRSRCSTIESLNQDVRHQPIRDRPSHPPPYHEAVRSLERGMQMQSQQQIDEPIRWTYFSRPGQTRPMRAQQNTRSVVHCGNVTAMERVGLNTNLTITLPQDMRRQISASSGSILGDAIIV